MTSLVACLLISHRFHFSEPARRDPAREIRPIAVLALYGGILSSASHGSSDQLADSGPILRDSHRTGGVSGSYSDSIRVHCGHLNNAMYLQVENWIARQHTLPDAIMMTHPIFPDPDRDLLKPTPAPTSVPVRRGVLKVTVGRISRLDPVLLNADGLFCILALGPPFSLKLP